MTASAMNSHAGIVAMAATYFAVPYAESTIFYMLPLVFFLTLVKFRRSKGLHVILT